MDGTNRRRKIPVASANVNGPAPEGEDCPSRRERDSGTPKSMSEIRGGFRAIGVAVSRLAQPILAKRGGGILVRLKSEWGAIVGPEWGEVTWPNALGRDGALKLRITSSTALELQHRAPMMIERINLFFGRAVIRRLTLVQGPLPLPVTAGGAPVRALAATEERALGERLRGVSDPDLRAALARLGRAMAGSGLEPPGAPLYIDNINISS
jgi:hypothetical protein